jgi:hypothetical protein
MKSLRHNIRNLLKDHDYKVNSYKVNSSIHANLTRARNLSNHIYRTLKNDLLLQNRKNKMDSTKSHSR